MSPCDEFSVKALRYLDDRLAGQELDDFRAHLEKCAKCREGLDADRAVSRLLHRSRPLYSAPPALRARVAAAVEQHSASIGTRENFYQRLLRIVESGFADPARRVARLRLLAATLAVAALVLAFAPNVVRQARAANYVEMAVATHGTTWMEIFRWEFGRTLRSRCAHGSRAKYRFSFACQTLSPTPAAYLPISSPAQAW